MKEKLRLILTVCKLLGDPSFSLMSFGEISYLFFAVCACFVLFLWFSSLTVCPVSKCQMQIITILCSDCGALSPGHTGFFLQRSPREYLWL